MRFSKRYFWCVSIAILNGLSLRGQTPIIDSLLKGLENAANDSVEFLYTNMLANEEFPYDTSKAKEYLSKGYSLAKKMNWDRGLAQNYFARGIHRLLSSEYLLANAYLDTAILFYQKAAQRAPTHKEKKDIALEIITTKGEIASNYLKTGRDAEAISIYLEALEAWKESEDPRKLEAIGSYYEKIATIYYGMKQFDKSLFYDKLSVSNQLQTNNIGKLAWAYVYECDDFIALHQMDSCLVYLNLARPLVQQLDNHHLNVQYFNKLAQIRFEKKEYRAAIEEYEKCVEEAAQANNRFQVMSNQRMIGVCYVRSEDYVSARKYFLLALPTAISDHDTKTRIKILQDLVTTEEKSNHPAIAYAYLKQVVTLRDSINAEESKRSITEIENKYQAAEKSKEIAQLNADKKIQSLNIKQKSTLNYFLAGALAAFLFVAFLGYRNLQHRHQLVKQNEALQQQQIRELEKDKQLVAVDSMLKGQEEERSRLAKDLHDGLGGLLSGVKFSLRNMKDNLVMTPENMVVFERSLDMIDTSIKELRRVAHNMMPEMLTKFGLDEALKEYCNAINTTRLLTVKYQSVGMESRIANPVEIIVYRILQELLNNTMKHSSATEVFVQLIRQENRLSIVVEDNGQGFDTSILKEGKGAGLVSIQSRVDYLKGQLAIHSSAGKGTLVNIELNL